MIEREKELIENRYFYISELKRYKTKSNYDSKGYISLLNTYPKIIKLDPDIRKEFLLEVEKIIKENGDVVTIPVLTSLYICSKKEHFTVNLGNTDTKL